MTNYDLGIDEAGRGPVIGPLVMAGCLTTPEIDKKLKEIGVKDSKLILPSKRNFLFEEVKKLVLDFEIIVVSPEEIDVALKNPDLNLNKLEALTSVKIMAAIYGRQKSGDKGFEVMLDSPTNTPAPYIAYVNSMLANDDVIVRAETKADMNYLNVGASSILAKVTRDRLIEDMKKTALSIVGDGEMGSGYPSDPKTKEFLKKYWNRFDDVKGGFFRKTWKTWLNVANGKSQKKLF